jgi:hypothetical protein
VAEVASFSVQIRAKPLETMSKSERAYWSEFVRETYRRSPVIGKHLGDFKDWYDPRLHRLVDGLAHLAPNEI